MNRKTLRWNVLEYLPFGVALALIFYRLQPRDGWLGHDYYHAFARLLIGAAHFWQNGLELPHYTPSLCGGIPFLADPQSTYFSLPQFFAFFVEPLAASLLSVGICYVIGYVGFLKLFTGVFGYGPKLSHAMSLTFVLNGFAFAHLYVGHLTHHSYLLFPAMLYFLLRPIPGTREVFLSAAWLALFLIYLFFSGGFHMLVVFFVLLALLLPYLVYAKSRNGELWRLAGLCGIVAIALLLCCSGKLVSSALFSKNFVRGSIDSSSLTVWQLVTQYFWFVPSKTPLFIKFGRIGFGPWEFVGFTSKIILPITLIAILLFMKGLSLGKFALASVYAMLVPYLCFLAAGQGENESIPFFKIYHNPIKILGAFIPVFTLLAAYALARLSPLVKFSSDGWRALAFLLFVACLLIEFDFYSKAFWANPLALGYHYDPAVYRELKRQGGISRVDEVVSEHGIDLHGLKRGCSSLKCYEPLFGYSSEKVNSQLELGKTATLADGKFNINHPGCFLYPSYFACQPWERVSSEDRDNFEKFVAGDASAWGVPPWQSFLWALNGVVIVCLLAFVATSGVQAPDRRARALRIDPVEA